MPIEYGNLSPALQALLPANSAAGILAAAAIVSSPGVRATNVLRLAANVAEGETVTITIAGVASVFEFDVVNTDSTVNTSGGNLNNTNALAQVTHAAHGRSAGDLVRVENEIMKVQRVIDANTYVVIRGRAGTTIATHADGLDIFISATPPASNIPVGLVTTLTPAVAGPALAAEINNALAGGERATSKASTIYPLVQATSLQTGAEVLLEAVSVGTLANAYGTTETLAGANNVWSAATMTGGVAAGLKRVQRASRVPTATEVALGFMNFTFPFTPAHVEVTVLVTASGLETAWIGNRTISGGRVRLDNAGGTDWAATDTVNVIAFE
jgi:hypothetical protein